MNATTLTAALKTMISPVCTQPEALTIRVAEESRFYGVMVQPAAADMPRLIGQAGANFQAMKGILNEAGEAHGLHIRFFVKDADPDRTTRAPRVVVADSDWQPETAVNACKVALALCKLPPDVRVVRQDGGRARIVVEPALPMQLGNGLSRWVHVIARSQGGHVDFDFPLLA